MPCLPATFDAITTPRLMDEPIQRMTGLTSASPPQSEEQSEISIPEDRQLRIDDPTPVPVEPASPPPLPIEEQKRRITSKAKALVRKCDIVIRNALKDLDEARLILEPLGLSVDSSILDPTFGFISGDKIAVLRTTGGHSNTDHVVKITGDPRKDRIEELKRNYQRRVRSSQPEFRGEDRWDKPKIPGERRRRIVREKDLPQAPPEPPPTGYVIFVAQMTTKIRHDRPDDPHKQTKVVQEISKIWKLGMTDSDREYYNDFAREAREEYQRLHQEYRATGRYQPSHKFEKLKGVGPWVRIAWHEKNGLERELATYETASFPLRPPQLDEAYEKRRLESVKRRKLKQISDNTNDSGNVSDEDAVDMSCEDDTYQYDGEPLGGDEEGNHIGYHRDKGVQEDFDPLFSHQPTDVNARDNYEELVTEIVEL